MKFLGTRLYGVRNISGSLTDRMTSQIFICNSSHFLKQTTGLLEGHKRPIVILQNSLMISRFVGLRLIIASIQVLFGTMPCLLKSYFVFGRLLPSHLSTKIWVCQNIFISAVSVHIGNCGLRCKIVEKISGHCLQQTERTDTACSRRTACSLSTLSYCCCNLLPTQHI
jgi:hypothetical protein